MRVVGLDGKTYRLDLRGKTPLLSEQGGSSGHQRCRALLARLFPLERRLEEVFLPGTGGLRADFFLPSPRLVIEVMGRQHRDFVSFFHETRLDFLRTRQRDRRKEEFCVLNELRYVDLSDDEPDEQWVERILGAPGDRGVGAGGAAHAGKDWRRVMRDGGVGEEGMQDSGSPRHSRLTEIEGLLERYEKTVGLSFFAEEDEVASEARNLLRLPHAVLRKMTPGECGEAGYVLRQFAFRLQQAQNREQAQVRWAEENIRKLIAKALPSCRGASLDERQALAVASNETACVIDKIRVHASLRVERLAFLSAKVSDLAKSIESLQHTKRGEKGD